MAEQIILCGTQRCGSTLIIEDMRNSGALGNPEEWFVPWDVERENVDWALAFAGVKKRGTGKNGVFAIKVMANQLFSVDACLASFLSPRGDSDFPHFVSAFPDAVWVKLVRQDYVAQAISRNMAQQTGVNHATAHKDDEHFAGNLVKGYKSSYNEKTVYRFGALLREVTAITLENLAWDRFFAMQGIKPLVLIYEDVIRDAELSHLDKMAKLLGINDPLVRRERAMVRLANDKNKNWRERFYQDAAKNRYQALKPTQKKNPVSA
ncbi:MAG: hypothetical protein JKX69_04830 [Rhodobacteraceae bacterium]|nr:hypothetical protein [Paracoccaceae bacterium]